MFFHEAKTIDGRVLWVNLDNVTSFSWDPGESICLVEVTGSQPHQISREDFLKLKPFLVKRKKTRKK